jgi:hypothetical protein
VACVHCPRPALPGRTVGRWRSRVPALLSGLRQCPRRTPAVRTAGAPGQARNNGGHCRKCPVPADTRVPIGGRCAPQRPTTQACGHAEPERVRLPTLRWTAAVPMRPVRRCRPWTASRLCPLPPSTSGRDGSDGAVVAGGRCPPVATGKRVRPIQRVGVPSRFTGARSRPVAARASERSTIRRSHDAACFCDGDEGLL